ncbi:MAG TPA: hypothetical protein VGD40_26365 [Chryseosolibacter sp.]
MKTSCFDELSLIDKALLVYEFALPLMSIEHYDFRIHLFSLNGHFIELYQKIETRQVHRISTVPYCELDKYLSRIVLGTLRRK